MRKARFIPLDRFDDQDPFIRSCDHEGCKSPGEFRAPKSPKSLREYFWFCLDHIREYNKTWDFYKGMSPDQIDESRISDMTWNRPSWPLGSWRSFLESVQYMDGLDPFINMGGRPTPLPKDVQKGLKTLDLSLPITVENLKKKYKSLVKLHHPDLHAGDKLAEERFKEVNEAYQVVKKHLGK